MHLAQSANIDWSPVCRRTVLEREKVVSHANAGTRLVAFACCFAANIRRRHQPKRSVGVVNPATIWFCNALWLKHTIVIAGYRLHAGTVVDLNRKHPVGVECDTGLMPKRILRSDSQSASPGHCAI